MRHAWPTLDPGGLEPEPGSLDVWTWDIRAPRAGDRDLLTEVERARADRLVIPAKARNWIASRAGLRRVLAPYVGAAPENLTFFTTEHGKPRLDDVELAFNLSHSGTKAVLAVTSASVRVGVDVEEARPGRSFESIARNFFADDERRALLASPTDDRPAVFYRYWTCKEAYLKAWGTGLTFPSSRFCVQFDPPSDDDARVVETQMPGDDEPGRWRFRTFGVDVEYPVALCWEGEPLRVRTATARL
jgi:4'-phosphopantetheinyl transferase